MKKTSDTTDIWDGILDNSRIFIDFYRISMSDVIEIYLMFDKIILMMIDTKPRVIKGIT
jgi:hypothetical protein